MAQISRASSSALKVSNRDAILNRPPPSLEMDRDWMSANRLTNADNPNLVHCPCLKCGNMERTLTMDDPDDYDDDFSLWGQSIGGESESDPAAPKPKPDPNSQPKKKNGRGHIRNRSQGILLEVEYNQWGQCIGDTANELSMFKLGPEAKHSTLKTRGRRWKDWKAFLTRNLIFEYKEKVSAMLDRPPDAYASCYKPEDWKAKRCSPEWAKKRKKMQDIRSQNSYNHHAGRGGVKKVEEKLEKELGHQLTIYDRADLCIRIRKNKNDELDGPA
ncbi:hypothetical protein G4B88_013069 [Cannabis sativa]|uniref:Uncharacterized protein n=1 Tax=Cannabis sativa TaxID=3483 RepID=A0A7J6F351_CANSA|nr:hypothetical protein G4B88_013069 [Cannabis sativa]